MRQINHAGLQLIKSFESLRLTAYDDGVGVWTIGYGHTRGVRRGDRITREQADVFLAQDLVDAQSAVESAVKVPINDNEYAALVSLVFNIGAGAFKRSSVLRHLNAGRRQQAANAILLYNKGGGRVMKGLVRRREAERALFLTPTKASLSESVALKESGAVEGAAGSEGTASPVATAAPQTLEEESGALPADRPKAGEAAPDTPAEAGQAIVGGRPGDPAKQVTTGGTKTLTVGGIGTVLISAWTWLKGNADTVTVAIIAVTLIVVLIIFRQVIMDYLRLKFGADPAKYNVR